MSARLAVLGQSDKVEHVQLPDNWEEGTPISKKSKTSERIELEVIESYAPGMAQCCFFLLMVARGGRG